MKKIAVLIPVFNNIEFTKKCISRLNQLTSRSRFKNCDIHTVVIDNGSTDGTSEWLMDSFSYGTNVVGPAVGAFNDLNELGLITTYSDLKSLIEKLTDYWPCQTIIPQGKRDSGSLWPQIAGTSISNLTQPD